MAERIVEYGPIWLNRDQHGLPIMKYTRGVSIRLFATHMMLVIAAKGQGIPENIKTKLCGCWTPGLGMIRGLIWHRATICLVACST